MSGKQVTAPATEPTPTVEKRDSDRDVTCKMEQGHGELAAISVSSRIPEFWTAMPRLWFFQLETIVRPQKLGDAAKYDLVITKLGCETLQQISDICFSPPENNKYDAIKERLLQVYEESAERQFQKLVSEMELGSQKPSHLLRCMKELGRNTQVSDKTIHSLWLSRLPSAVRAVLTVSQDQTLDNLANMADKIMENTKGEQIAEVHSSGSQNQLPVSDLVTQIHKMSLEIASLREEVKDRRQQYRRSRSRGYGRGRGGFRGRAHSRSSSRPRMTPEHPNWLCRYHFRFRERARACEKPCAWKLPSQSSSPEN